MDHLERVDGEAPDSIAGAVDLNVPGAYRAILDALPTAVYATDADGFLTYFNGAAAELATRLPRLGVDRWSSPWRLLNPDGSRLAKDGCPLARTLRGERPVEGVEVLVERPDGTRIPVVPCPTLLFDGRSRITGAVNMLMDISARKAAEAELRERSERLAAIAIENGRLLQSAQREVEWQRRADQARQQLVSIIESSDDAIVSKNLDGIIVSWNQGAERLFGYTPEETIGRSVTMLMPEDRRSEEVEILARLRRGERVQHFETVRMRKDGTLVDVSLTVSPVLDGDGRVTGASKIARDVTARRRTEAALARHGEEQAVLFRLTDGLNRADSLPDVHAAGLDAIQSLLGCERASVLLFDEAGRMRFVAWRGLSDPYRHAVDGHSPWAVGDKSPEPLCIADVAASDLPADLKATILGERIAACAFIPLVANGSLIGKFMTYYDAPHALSAAEVRLAVVVARQLAFAITKKRAEEDLRTNEERLRLATQAGKVGVWEWDVLTDRVTWTDSLYAMYGITRDGFQGTAAAVGALTHPEDQHRVADAMQASIADGTPCEVEFRVIRPDGKMAWLFSNAAVVFEQGRAVRLLGATIDVTERKEADAQRDLLVAELSHRVKNTLATVISIGHQSFAKSASPEEARLSFDGRIRALAQTHGRLAEGNWSGASFEAMLLDELIPYRRDDGGNVRLSGPMVTLAPREAVILGMAFHELATNAAKYGALSTKHGTVDVSWTIASPSRELHIRWAESGGPPVVAPTRSGFGRLLLERALASDLQGTVTLDFAEAGLTCEIRVPLDAQSRGLH